MYLVKTPWWLRALYPGLVWRIKEPGKTVYLTFDDGPHERATPFVLEELKKYAAKASFFCIGKNVAAYQNIYQRILDEGHSTGNHTYRHANGWKVRDEIYLNEIAETAELVTSNLFRPPYGRIKRSQQKKLVTRNPHHQTIMWDVLSGDFDTTLSPEDCLANVIKHSSPGSIIVFHDSAKAFERLQYALPRLLEHLTNEGYQMKALPQL